MEDKAISPVVGMVMVLAIIAGFMSIIQTQQLPQWNKQKEAEHYKLLVSEFSRIPYILSTGTTASISLDAGLDYPDIPLLINPPDAVSTLRFEERNVTVECKIVTPDGSTKTISRNYTSYAIILEPHYFYSAERELVLEHGVIFEKWAGSSRPVPITDQVTFTKSRITIPVLQAGNESITASKFSFKLSPVSKGGEVTVKDVNITFKTEFADWWRDTLSEIYGAGNVSVSSDNSTVIVRISAAVLDVSSYAVGEVSESSQSDTYKELELVPYQSEIVVSAGSVERIDVQAMDYYGNPVAGLTVNATASLGDITGSATTDSRGIATFYFTAEKAGSGYINFTATRGSVTSNASVIVTVPGVEIVSVSNETSTYSGCCCCRFSATTSSINVTAKLLAKDPGGKLISFVLMEGTTAIGNGVSLTDSSGYATCEFTGLGTGTYTIYAYYGTAYDNVTVEII